MIRMLIAREFDVAKAQIMWENWVKWRIDLQIDNINPKEFEDVI